MANRKPLVITGGRPTSIPGGDVLDLTGADITAPGLDTQITYNDSGLLGADAFLTFDVAISHFHVGDLNYDGTTANFDVGESGINCYLYAGSGTTGGIVDLFGGEGTAGPGGAAQLIAGTGTTSGGEAVVRGGNGVDNGNGGLASLTGGAGAGAGNGGNVLIQAGSGVTSGVITYTTTGGYETQRTGNFAAIGDAQSKQYILRTLTVDAGADDEMFLDGTAGTRRMVIPTDTTWFFEGKIVARDLTSDDGAAYTFEGAIDNNAGTTALLAAVVPVVVHEDDAAWDVVIAADDANDALTITVTGDAANNVRWVAYVRTVEVTG